GRRITSSRHERADRLNRHCHRPGDQSQQPRSGHWRLAARAFIGVRKAIAAVIAIATRIGTPGAVNGMAASVTAATAVTVSHARWLSSRGAVNTMNSAGDIASTPHVSGRPTKLPTVAPSAVLAT